MRTKTIFIFFACLAVSVVLTAKTTDACVCSSSGLNQTDREDAAGQFAAAAVVFEGEVIRVGGDGAANKGDDPTVGNIAFRIIRLYKGEHVETIQIFDPMAGTDCGFDQRALGGKFFVYGFQSKDGKIFIQSCSRTGPMESAGPDLRYARGEPATKEDLTPPGDKWRLRGDPSLATRGATLRGKVRRFGTEELTVVFLTVWRVNDQGRRTNFIEATEKTNADGSYEVRFLPPGRYLVTAEDSRMTPDARFVGEYGNISLAEGQVSVGVDVMLRPEPLGKITIQVKAPPELHDRIFVWLRGAQIDSVGSPPYSYAQTSQLDENGAASFAYVPYGLYDVYVMLTGDAQARQAWTHDKVQVQLNKREAMTIVTLRRNLPK
jgi:hypothetical protein